MSKPYFSQERWVTPIPSEHNGHPSDLETASKALSQDEKAVLHVIDAPYDGTAPQVRAVFNFGDDIAEGMRGLPPHSSGTARILDVTIHSDFVITGLRATKGPPKTQPVREELMRFLQEEYLQPFEERRIFRWRNDPLLVNDIGSISAQWSQRLGDGNSQFYRLVNRTSLQHDPLDWDLHPRDSYLTCARDGNERLVVIIVNDVWSEQAFPVNKSEQDSIQFENPRLLPGMLDGTSWTAFSDGSIDTFTKLLTLDFFLDSIYLQDVDHYGKLIFPQLPEKEVLRFSLTKNPHLQVPLGLFEPRLSAKSDEAFREIADAEGILRSVDNLVDSIDFLLGNLEPGYAADPQQFRSIQFKNHIAKLKALCKERRNNAKRALDALNRQLDYLTKKHAIREAKAIKILTILASLYLPMSLSASLLSMQSPFKQIVHNRPIDDTILLGTNLLFDFFGVFVGLAALTIFIVYSIRSGLWIKSNGLRILSKISLWLFPKSSNGQFSFFYYGRRWRFGGRRGTLFEFLYKATAWFIGAVFCVTLLVIFLIGMLRDAQSAWDIAQWMFITYILVSGLLSISVVVVYLTLRKKIRD